MGEMPVMVILSGLRMSCVGGPGPIESEVVKPEG